MEEKMQYLALVGMKLEKRGTQDSHFIPHLLKLVNSLQLTRCYVLF